MTRPIDADVVVVGGGLAGITSALRLADAGAQVMLLESKPRLGGLTTSFTRESTVGPLTVDTGQHVFLRCCTSYLSLLDRLGVRDQTVLQPRLDVPVARLGDPRRARLRRDRLPVVAGLPLQLGRALLGYSLLPLHDRIACSQAIRALREVDPSDPATDRTAFGDWLVEHGQTGAAIETVWELIGIATLNARAADASLALAATVFQTGLLQRGDAADIGWSAVPLGQLHGTAAAAALRAAGVDLRLRQRVRAVTRSHQSTCFTISLSDGSEITAGAAVVATEPAASEQLVPADALDLAPGWSDRLGATPIINAHFIVDGPVLDEPLLALPGSDLQFLFDRTETSGLDRLRPGAQHVVASISAADELGARPVADLRNRLLAQLQQALPAAGSAQLLDFFITREPHATWRQRPGQAAFRPATATRLPGLALAGAHVDTGWPATMEGAVRSGDAAAAHLLSATGRTPSAPSYPTPSKDAA